MATHRLPTGRSVIDGLVALGSALGYIAKREMPVERGRPNPPAVDVAWLGEEGQDYPLMIFEVESKITNSAANNPVKVFGQPNERFEKPLFFFHVFVAAGEDTSRVENLRTLFGSHNYRAYHLDRDGKSRLVLDILSQHRRLHKNISIGRLVEVLKMAQWHGVDVNEIIHNIEALQFAANLPVEYARLSLEDRSFREHFARQLMLPTREPLNDTVEFDYGTYMGNIWYSPIHLGLLALWYPHSAGWLGLLQHWQERSTYLSMIGPHLGRSRDYDEFVLGLAPPFWALVAALMFKIDGAAMYIGTQYEEVLAVLPRAEPKLSFFTAVWMLHVAAAANDCRAYEYARHFINERGGISSHALYNPPSMVSIQEPDEEWTAAIYESRIPVPEMLTFHIGLSRHYISTSDAEEDLGRLATTVLIDDEIVRDWAPIIVSVLAMRRG